jgi:hypothetical protein
MADQEAKTKTIGYLPVEKAQSLAGLLKTTAPAGNIEFHRPQPVCGVCEPAAIVRR